MDLSALALVAVLLTAAPPEKVDVFESGDGGYHTYRIPATIVTAKGTVLAFCEGRKDGRSDTGNIDTVLRRSLDGGKTWEPMQVVADQDARTIGNPTPVVERESGTIWLLLTGNHGSDRQSEIVAGTSREPRTIWVSRSDDDGLAWSKPVEISDVARQENWSWYGTGPGNGIQLRSGRLVIPCYHGRKPDAAEFSHLLTSDDRGGTWKLGAAVDDNNTGESAVVELPDGELLLSCRPAPKPTGVRYFARSLDQGKSWQPAKLKEPLVDSGCQGSLVRQSWPEGGAKSRLLFCNPAPGKRAQLTVRASYDEGKTWPESRVLEEGSAAYSSLVPLAGDWVGVLYERDDYRKITFASFALDWLAAKEK